ncbi:MAG TPA: malto-oligosyltrehalose trehalohydrolase [Steroidobacteraceae bacterium]|jgi:malto-oligosyltrehalose trehalohydrolase
MSRHIMPFGAELQSDRHVRFSLWAPGHERIGVTIDEAAEPEPMQRQAHGWHRLTTSHATAGSRYRFVLPDGFAVPDPASRFQPDDVHGASEVIDPEQYQWRDQDWHGRPWNASVIYELHLGTFTAVGTFVSAIERLDHLVELGVTVLEIMPVADFPGRRNWGYDGVLPFAPDSSYGRPEHFKALIDAAHARGLSVLLDVVYNHLGPEGSYLSRYAPQFFNDRHQTPWGAAINFDGEGSHTVREFFIHNAVYWLEEYHLDGLRLDAVHAIADDSKPPILEELARRVRAEALPRNVHLILENEHNQAHWLERNARADTVLYDAQWNDDVHHALHATASGEAEGYYADYRGRTDRLGRALAQGFAFQGELMPYRGSKRGVPAAHLPPSAFVAFLQNHDQIGNRALGERLDRITDPAALRAVTAVYLLLPQVPMLFMGEEWHSTRPFLFFSDFGHELADAVREGRRQEFARFEAFRDPAQRQRIPDPQAEQSFDDSKLDWDHLGDPAHRAVMLWYRDLLAVRRRHVVPLMTQLTAAGEFQVIDQGAIVVRWSTSSGAELTLMANLSPHVVSGFPEEHGRLLWQEGGAAPHGVLPAWSMRWSLRA